MSRRGDKLAMAAAEARDSLDGLRADIEYVMFLRQQKDGAWVSHLAKLLDRWSQQRALIEEALTAFQKAGMREFSARVK